jgi:hypothetical protein
MHGADLAYSGNGKGGGDGDGDDYEHDIVILNLFCFRFSPISMDLTMLQKLQQKLMWRTILSRLVFRISCECAYICM